MKNEQELPLLPYVLTNPISGVELRICEDRIECKSRILFFTSRREMFYADIKRIDVEEVATDQLLTKAHRLIVRNTLETYHRAENQPIEFNLGSYSNQQQENLLKILKFKANHAQFNALATEIMLRN